VDNADADRFLACVAVDIALEAVVDNVSVDPIFELADP
jgi:hypothetical protein